MSVVVLVPVLDRPQRAKPLADSLRATSDAFLVFLASRGDRRELRALRATAAVHRNVEVVVVPFANGHGDYARKINHGVAITSEAWILQAADDLRFHPGWEDAAMDAARLGHRVIGTNDLCNPRVMRGRHSTHSLVARSYIEDVGTVDEPGKLLHEGYWHNFCDDELVQAALYRGEFAHAHASHVEHLHPNCGTAEIDRTYQRGLDGKHFGLDRRLFRTRQATVFQARRRPVAGEAAR